VELAPAAATRLRRSCGARGCAGARGQGSEGGKHARLKGIISSGYPQAFEAKKSPSAADLAL
jgi:hypothetical protein